jgi:hypothetical protein
MGHARGSKHSRDFSVSLFYSLAVVFLFIGVVIEYFKVPLGGMPGFSQLVGRTLIAGVLLVSYPEIANAVADVADALANRIGDLNSYKLVLGKAGEALKSLSWSWSSIGDTFIFVISYLAFYILHVTVYFLTPRSAYASGSSLCLFAAANSTFHFTANGCGDFSAVSIHL